MSHKPQRRELYKFEGHVCDCAGETAPHISTMLLQRFPSASRRANDALAEQILGAVESRPPWAGVEGNQFGSKRLFQHVNAR
jgi:hypothetical protein